jgi:hypothetical protein
MGLSGHFAEVFVHMLQLVAGAAVALQLQGDNCESRLKTAALVYIAFDFVVYVFRIYDKLAQRCAKQTERDYDSLATLGVSFMLLAVLALYVGLVGYIAYYGRGCSSLNRNLLYAWLAILAVSMFVSLSIS